MTNFRDSFINAMYDVPFRCKFIEELEAVVVWLGISHDKFIVDFNSTENYPIKSLEIVLGGKLRIFGKGSYKELSLVSIETTCSIKCLDGSVLSCINMPPDKKIIGNTFIDLEKVKFSKVIKDKINYYDEWFNVVNPEPLNFILPWDINTSVEMVQFKTSDILQVIRGITIYWRNYIILPEWRAIGEHPYYVRIGEKKYILLKYKDHKFNSRICLTNESECIEFNLANWCEPIDGLYDGCKLSKLDSYNPVIHIGDQFLEYLGFSQYFIVVNASNPKSGHITKGILS